MIKTQTRLRSKVSSLKRLCFELEIKVSVPPSQRDRVKCCGGLGVNSLALEKPKNLSLHLSLEPFEKFVVGGWVVGGLK